MRINEFVTEINEAKKQKKKKKAINRISTGGKKKVDKFRQYKNVGNTSQAARATFGDDKQKKIAEKEIFVKTMNTIVGNSKASAISKIESSKEFKELKLELKRSEITSMGEAVDDEVSYKPLSFFSKASPSLARVSNRSNNIYKDIKTRENKLVNGKGTYFIQNARIYVKLKENGLSSILSDYLAGAFLLYCFTNKKNFFGYAKKQKARDLALSFNKYEEIKRMSPEQTIRFINTIFPSFLKSSPEKETFKANYITEKGPFETLLGRGIIFENEIQRRNIYKERLRKSEEEGYSIFKRLMGGEGKSLPTSFITINNKKIETGDNTKNIEKALKKENANTPKKIGKPFEDVVKMVLEKIGIQTDKNIKNKFPDLFVTKVGDGFKGIIKVGDFIEVKSGTKVSAKTKPSFNTLIDEKIIYKDGNRYYFDIDNLRKKLYVFGIPAKDNVIFVKKGSGSDFLSMFKSNGAIITSSSNKVSVNKPEKIKLKFKDTNGEFPLLYLEKKQKNSDKKALRDRSYYFGGSFNDNNFFNPSNSFKNITVKEYENLFKR